MKNYLLFLGLFVVFSFKLNAQTLSWSGFPAGGTSYTTGIMTTTVTSSVPGFQYGTPKYIAGTTNGGGFCSIANSLNLEQNFGNITTAYVTLGMDFTTGGTTNGLCGNISFQIKDINADESFQGFSDWVEVSAIDGNNNPVPVANITATGGSNKTISTSGNTRIVVGHSNGAYGSRSSTACDNVTFSVTPAAGTTLKTVILKYHPEYTASPNDYYSFTGPKRPAYQYISISPITVNATAGPTSVLITTTPTSCAQNNGTVAIGTVTGGVAPYLFNFNNLGLGTTTNFSNLGAGTYPIIVQDNAGCILSTNAFISLTSGPTAIINNITNASCGQNNGSVTLGTVTGGIAPYQYNFNNLGLATTTTFSNLAPGTYPLVIQDNAGCTHTMNITIGQNSGPTSILNTQTNETCGQANGTITLGNVIGGTAPYQYNFNNLGLSTTTFFSNLSAGNYSLVVQDNVGCSYSTSITITSTSGPTAVQTTPSSASCGASNGSLNIGSVTGGTSPYQYNFNGLGFSTTTNYSTLAAGNYTLIVKDNNGCTYSTTVTIGTTTNGPNSIVATLVNENCGQGNGSIVLGTVSGGTAPYQFNFNNLGLSTTIAFTNLSAGNYTLTIQDNNGCSHDTIFVLTTISGPTAAQITTIGEACSQGNGSVSIGVITGGTAPYQFSFNAGAFGATTNFNSLTAGTYPIIVKDAAGCTFTTNAMVSAISGPSAVQTTIINEVCGQQNGGFTIGTITGGTAPFQFNFNNLGFSSFMNYSNLGIGNYPLIVKDANGCTFTTSVQIGGTPTGPQSVNLSIQAPQCGSSDGSLNIVSVGGGASPYVFNIDNSGSFTNTTVSTILTGSYQLSVTDANGCSITTNFAIPISNDSIDIHIPNVFSPNGDAANPTWFIVGNCIQTLECVIVNRWGDVMRTFTSYTDEWDGTFNGKNVLAGVYFYKATVHFSTGKTEVYHGHITVVY